MVHDSRATRQTIVDAQRAQEAAARAELRKGEQAIRDAQRKVVTAARATNRAEAEIKAAQVQYDAAVRDVPKHMRSPTQGAVARGRSPGSGDY